MPHSRSLPWRQPLPGVKRKPSPVGLEAETGKAVLRLEAWEARLLAGLDPAEERLERQVETLQRHLGRLGVHREISGILTADCGEALALVRIEIETRAMR